MYDLIDERWLKKKPQLGKPSNKVVVTFDDGPSRQLPAILDILGEKSVPAIFFWQTKLLHPLRPWQRVIDEGHEIGSHTINHQNLTKLTFSEQFRQILSSITKIEKITGRKVRYFRPPFGQYNEDTMVILQELGLIPVMWEISSYDWENTAQSEDIINNVVNYTKRDSIILLHETKQTVVVLPKIIDGLRNKGFEFSLLE
ncbi:polysaccharide deacetylase family protein [Anaerobacillus sp. CMMVII]|nr:polysaccharide deacetylase family protein [Anaerobacillus sp. CMMVII]